MIWCVEDDASIRDIEVYALSSAGFAARGFEDGSSFYAAITGEKEKPQLIVLDVMLPGIDGIELLRRIRANAALKQIPIVMATAKGSEYDRIQGLDLGADYYLTKPFGVMELISCVKAVLRRCGAAKRSWRWWSSKPALMKKPISIGPKRLSPLVPRWFTVWWGSKPTPKCCWLRDGKDVSCGATGICPRATTTCALHGCTPI